MPLVHSLLEVPPGAALRLDDFLFGKLPAELAEMSASQPLSRTKIRSLIMEHHVHCEGRVLAIPGRLVLPGQRIVVRIDTERLFAPEKSRDPVFEPDKLCIVHEDEFLLVVAKPAGIPVDQTFVASRDNLVSLLQRFLVARDKQPCSELTLQHRLDRETSGLVLFSKKSSVNKMLHELFLKRLVVKGYQALVSRPAGSQADSFAASPADSWVIENNLARISPASQAAKWGSVPQDGKPARTTFRVLNRYPCGLHLEACPQTGRTHQIRVHLAEAQLPILGDSLYGGLRVLQGWPVPRVMLHAGSLAFTHPVSACLLQLTLPPPADFMACVQRLQNCKKP
jgi:23S rRNA pseudouridine1911/1915/1917 synthase